MKNKFKLILVSVVAALPIASYAQYLTKTDGIFLEVARLVGILVPVAFTAALLFFFWGIVKYIRSEGTGKEEGRQIMIWGVVALFVMSSVWGLVRFIQTEFTISDNSAMKIPTLTP